MIKESRVDRPSADDTASAADVWAVLAKALLGGLLAPSRRK
ncbi:MAG: hypothetical protein Q8N26_14960 [Myxococcales bacterium]|nr:hypothetical protein [Myxococcales bacterium]